jgi:prepilin-type N-terminal cleavage/methylation domain-containing protein
MSSHTRDLEDQVVTGSAGRQCRSRRDAGFSLIEVLITSVMVVSIALSTMPMFTQAMVNNTAGMDSTKVANEARSHLERMVELSFGSPELTLSAGAAKQTSEYFSILTKNWHPFPLPPGSAGVLWTRVTTVRQYGLSAIADGVLDPIEALDVEAVPEAVHLKEIVVAVQQTGAAFGPAKRISLETLKVK